VTTELVYGVHPVEEALRAGRRKLVEVVLAKGAKEGTVAGVRYLAEKRRVPVRFVGPGFWKAARLERQPAALKAGPLPETDVEGLLQAVSRAGGPGLVLLLDRVADPQNLGALARSALCAGAHGLVLAKRRSAPLSPAASKASAGALEHVLVARAPNLVRAVERFKENGYWVFGADAAGGRTIWEADFSTPVVLCIGAEGRGLSRLLAERCDFLVRIPQKGPVASLNASAAGAVLLFEAARQRRRFAE